MQIYFNIRNILPSVPNFAADKSIDEGNRKTSGEGTFEQIIEVTAKVLFPVQIKLTDFRSSIMLLLPFLQLPLSPGLVPNRIRQVGTLTQNKYVSRTVSSVAYAIEECDIFQFL